jgi:hypothetical protein
MPAETADALIAGRCAFDEKSIASAPDLPHMKEAGEARKRRLFRGYRA